MFAPLPSVIFPCFSKKQQTLLPLEAKLHINSLKSSCECFSSKNRILNEETTQLSVDHLESAHGGIHLLNDWPHLLQTSIGSGDFLLAQAIHGFLVKLSYRDDAFRGNNLINMYAKLHKLCEAERLFDEMLDKNLITWTTLINGYSRYGDAKSVFRIASVMYRLEKFNEHTCSVILGACGSSDDRIQGEQLHGFTIKTGFAENVIVGTSLISMYFENGSVEEAEKLFDDLTYKDVRCMNLFIHEYGKMDCVSKAVKIFLQLLSCGLVPDGYTFTNIIDACEGEADTGIGKQLHGLATKYGVMGETSVRNAIVTMYGNCEMVEEAEGAFYGLDGKNLISWTALMSAYVKNGHGRKALERFTEMVDVGVHFDSSCVATVLDGCSECKDLDLGSQLHGLSLKLSFISDANVATALIDLYVKCGNFISARLLFDSLSVKTTPSFNAILVGCTKIDGGENDLMMLLNKLRLCGMKPDSVTFVQLLSLSADQASLVKGRSLHAYAIKTGFVSDISVGNALITMYAKSGSIKEAYQSFHSTNHHDIISWNALLSAYALHTRGKEALLLFENMMNEGFVPDEITILGVLQACSYSGILDYGICIFNDIELKYELTPTQEHFACMVDMLGRTGKLYEALDFIERSPFSDSPLLWRTLVHTCKLIGDLQIGKIASERLLGLLPNEPGSYILVSNMYAGEGMLKEAGRVRTVMNDIKLSKDPGCSWIDIDTRTHVFMASSKDHTKSREIYALLDLLLGEMRQLYDD